MLLLTLPFYLLLQGIYLPSPAPRVTAAAPGMAFGILVTGPCKRTLEYIHSSKETARKAPHEAGSGRGDVLPLQRLEFAYQKGGDLKREGKPKQYETSPGKSTTTTHEFLFVLALAIPRLKLPGKVSGTKVQARGAGYAEGKAGDLERRDKH